MHSNVHMRLVHVHVHVLHISIHQELGQTREVNVLWLLTLSAPKARVDAALEKRLDAIAATLVVP